MRCGLAVELLLPLMVAVSVPGDDVTERPAWVERTVVALGDHLADHPEAEAADVYKLLHQAVMGPGHAIPDRDSAAQWLEDELAGLGPPGPDERLCEPLGGEPAMVRIHLRPFVAAGGNRDRLLEAFVATANDVVPQPERLAVLLEAVVARLAAEGRSDLADGLERLGAELEPQGFPAIHHSETFEKRDRPAYRVLALDRVRNEGWCD